MPSAMPVPWATCSGCQYLVDAERHEPKSGFVARFSAESPPYALRDQTWVMGLPQMKHPRTQRASYRRRPRDVVKRRHSATSISLYLFSAFARAFPSIPCANFPFQEASAEIRTFDESQRVLMGAPSERCGILCFYYFTWLSSGTDL